MTLWLFTKNPGFFLHFFRDFLHKSVILNPFFVFPIISGFYSSTTIAVLLIVCISKIFQSQINRVPHKKMGRTLGDISPPAGQYLH